MGPIGREERGWQIDRQEPEVDWNAIMTFKLCSSTSRLCGFMFQVALAGS